MNFEDANKTQLLTIALHEDCPLEYKYEACRELELKRWDSVFLIKLVRLWGNGMTKYEIADKLGVEVYEVSAQLTKYGLWKRRVKDGFNKAV